MTKLTNKENQYHPHFLRGSTHSLQEKMAIIDLHTRYKSFIRWCKNKDAIPNTSAAVSCPESSV